MIVEIVSEKEAGGDLELILRNGKTFVFEDDDDSTWEGKVDDVMPDGEEEETGIAAMIGVREGPLPQSLTLPIALRYDNSLLRDFNNDHSKTKQWLSRVVQLAKPKMKLIDITVHLKVTGVEHYNKDVGAADDQWIQIIRKDSRNRGVKGPISYFCNYQRKYLLHQNKKLNILYIKTKNKTSLHQNKIIDILYIKTK